MRSIWLTLKKWCHRYKWQRYIITLPPKLTLLRSNILKEETTPQLNYVSYKTCLCMINWQSSFLPTAAFYLHYSYILIFKTNLININFNFILWKAQLNNCIDWILWLYINKNYYYYYRKYAKLTAPLLPGKLKNSLAPCFCGMRRRTCNNLTECRGWTNNNIMLEQQHIKSTTHQGN